MTTWRMRIACWIPKSKDTLRTRNAYWFFTATMVAWTRLSVRLYVFFFVDLLLYDLINYEMPKSQGVPVHPFRSMPAPLNVGYICVLRVVLWWSIFAETCSYSSYQTMKITWYCSCGNWTLFICRQWPWDGSIPRPVSSIKCSTNDL